MKMLIISILWANIIIAAADKAMYNGYCDKNEDVCEFEEEKDIGVVDLRKNRLLFYDVNPQEGFNLRRDVYMRFAIMLEQARGRGERKNWRLVLPPFFNLYHWRSEPHRNHPKTWGIFFDVPSLQSYVPVFELTNVMVAAGAFGLTIDSLYVLQNYDDPFENGVFEDKWDIVGPCKYEDNFWGVFNIRAKRVICVRFQGSISHLWEIIDSQPEDKKVMFARAEIPLHDTYGTKTFWDCRKSMVFSRELVAAAEVYITEELHCHKTRCSNYLAVHWRRQDFTHANRSTSVVDTAIQIDKAIRKNSLEIRDVFIASDGTQKELEQLQKQIESLGYTAHFYKPGKYMAGQAAIIEQIICSRSAYFIGTHESTFTYRIQEEREIMGFDSDTTFNRLCPDFGECEKPSRWTIVH